MAKRTDTMTITKPVVHADDAEGRPVSESHEKRPRNLPPVGIAAEGFALLVDGKAKAHHATAAAATEAGLKLKRAFPMLQVMVYDAAEKTRSRIELPGAVDAAPASRDASASKD